MHTSNALTITFNVSINFEKGWSSLDSVTYKASWQQDLITVCNYPSSSKSLSEFSHKLNLTGIPEGKQTVWIHAKGRGGYQDDKVYFYFDDAYNYASISFTIDTIPPKVSGLSVEN